MAHYALLDENNVVVQVITGKNENEEGKDWEEWYGKFFNLRCKRTSYNSKFGKKLDPNNGNVLEEKAFRINFAQKGFIYDAKLDGFIEPKPTYASWILNEQEGRWQAPVPCPIDDQIYVWDEPTVSWKVIPSNTIEGQS